MSNAILFRWEDTPSLNHHCGFCERPLSHPGARSSCFGTHSEPCARFHQAMFMRGRAHACASCIGAEEAHHKRHAQIAENLREIYEHCGEDTSLEPGCGTDAGTDNGTPDDDTSSYGDFPFQSKKERKKAKRLLRAAIRPKFITQGEIQHVGHVLHPPRDTSSYTDNPSNTEEVEEIERHLRYNANVYNNKVKRVVLRGFAKLHDVEVDFEVEMDRILTSLRITAIIRRNSRNQGLQGRDLRIFEQLLEGFKRNVVEDLVLLKKEEIEIRMRRAGYLRYANRASFDIIEDRYRFKDWKTGERIIQEEEVVETSGQEAAEPFKENVPLVGKSNPDRRHLTQSHTRVHGNGTVDKAAVMVDQPTPSRLPTDFHRPANVLRITPPTGEPAQPRSLSDIANRPSYSAQLGTRQPTPPQTSSPWSSPGPSQKSTSPPLPPSPQADGPLLLLQQAPVDVEPTSHPPVPTKKIKKKEREAKRKAKRRAEAEHEAQAQTTLHDELLAETPILYGIDCTGPDDEGDIPVPVEECLEKSASAGQSMSSPLPSSQMAQALTTPPEPPLRLVSPKLPAPPPVTTKGRFTDWRNYTRHFQLDTLTDPFRNNHSCIHECPFLSLGLLDCIYHGACTDYNPFQDKVYLVHPSSSNPLSLGPYNHFRAKKLLSSVNKEPLVKDRLMIVDDDMLEYFSRRPMSRINARPPSRLASEYRDHRDGYKEGSLMKQEKDYSMLLMRNESRKTRVTMEQLQGLLKKAEPPCDAKSIVCYCRAPRADDDDIAECQHVDCVVRYFHKECVKDWYPDAWSRWYCVGCDSLITDEALELEVDLARLDRKLRLSREQDVEGGDGGEHAYGWGTRWMALDLDGNLRVGRGSGNG